MKTLLQRLIQTDSTPQAGEAAAARVLAGFLRDAGVDCRVDAWGENRANCIARVRGAGRRKPLLFLGHLDVVPPGDAPWQSAPFSGLDRDGRIHGRGATDMKGGLAAVAMALGDIVRSNRGLPGDVILAATAGEETDSAGVTRLVAARDQLPELVGIVVPEPTDFQVIGAHRGLLWLEIETYGRTAHSSMPHLGVNAVTAMTTVLAALDRLPLDPPPHPRLGSCSLSPNTIAGGRALNVVPDRCTLGLDIRLLPGQDPAAIVRALEALLAEVLAGRDAAPATVTIRRSVPALDTSTDNPFVRTVCRHAGVAEPGAVGFTTDGPFLAPLGAPVLIVGPGRAEDCHQPDESIAWADMERAVALYRELILSSLDD